MSMKIIPPASPSIDIETLERRFLEIFGDLPCGGFINPTMVFEDEQRIMFRCFYNGCDWAGDCWYYEYDKTRCDFEYLPIVGYLDGRLGQITNK